MKCGDDLNLAVLMTPFEDVLKGIWTPDKEYPPIAGAATPKWHANGLKYIANGAVDLDTDTIKLMLVTASWTPNQSTDTFASAFSTNEASGGSGYPAGGFSLGTLSVAVSTLTMNWDAADISQAITGGPLAFQYGDSTSIGVQLCQQTK